MKKYLAGWLTGWVILPVLIYIALLSGAMPVATKGAPLPGEKFLAKTALHAAFRDHLADVAPIGTSEENFLAGAKIYKNNCAVCHGLPGHAASPIAQGLFPPAPKLFVDGVDDDPVGETFWKIKNGIRLTGMPGFEKSYNDLDIWKVTLLLKSWNSLPPTIKKELEN